MNRRASFTRRVSLTKRRSSISRDNSTATTNTNNNNNTLGRQQQQSSFTRRRSFKERLETLPIEPLYCEVNVDKMSPEELEAKKRVGKF